MSSLLLVNITKDLKKILLTHNARNHQRIMSRCSSLTFGLLATLLFAATAVNCSHYSSNMFLNGEYQNGLQYRHDDDQRVSSGAAAFISMLSKRASPFVGQQYLPTLLECRGRGQQCVPKNQCINGYFTQQLPKVQVSYSKGILNKIYELKKQKSNKLNFFFFNLKLEGLLKTKTGFLIEIYFQKDFI